MICKNLCRELSNPHISLFLLLLVICVRRIVEGNLASRLKIVLGPMGEECRRYCMFSVILPISHTIVTIIYFDVAVG